MIHYLIIGAAIAFAVVIRQISQLNKRFAELTQNLVKLETALSQYVQHNYAHNEFNTLALKYILSSERMKLLQLKQKEIDRENYEAVKQYDDLIDEINELIQTQL